MAKKGLYYNINQKKKGMEPVILNKKSTITDEAYANMKVWISKKKK